LVTGRRAARQLRDVLSSDEHARLLLRTGIAGRGEQTSNGVLFDDARVAELCHRPAVDRKELARRCPHGLMVVRLPRSTRLDVTGSWREVADQVVEATSRQRPMTPWSVALASVRIRAWGPLPLAATLLGYVVLPADLTGLGEHGPVLAPPGSWAGAVEGRRLHTPRGGRAWRLWAPSTVDTARSPGG
jgi:hypothetical protein